MKLILATAACALACSALAGTNDVPVLEEPVDSALQANAGADVRIREEIMHNVPGLPGAPGAMMPRDYKKNLNHLRVRPRVWGQLDYEIGCSGDIYSIEIDQHNQSGFCFVLFC